MSEAKDLETLARTAVAKRLPASGEGSKIPGCVQDDME